MNTIFRERSPLFYNKVENLQDMYIDRIKKFHMCKYYLKDKNTQDMILMAKNYKSVNKISIYLNDVEYGTVRYDRFCNVYKLYKQHILQGIFFYKEGQFQFNLPKYSGPINFLNMRHFETENSLTENINSKKNRKVFEKNKLIFSLNKFDNYKFGLKFDIPISLI